MKKRLFPLLFLLFLLNSCDEIADKKCDLPAKPNPNRLVNDYASVMSASQQQELEKILRGYSVSTTTDISVITISDLCNYTPAEFSFKIIDQWGIGKADKDNGLLILVVPKENSYDGKGHCFIATGRGLEGAIPDAVAKRIVEEQMIPLFKQQQYFAGIMAGVNASMSLASKDFQPAAIKNGGAHRPKEPKMPLLTGLLIIGGVIVFWAVYLLRKTSAYSRTNHTSFWTGWFLMNAMNRHHGGYWGGFKGGGGGWGGFGGGSSGGGGAGGSW